MYTGGVFKSTEGWFVPDLKRKFFLIEVLFYRGLTYLIWPSCVVINGSESVVLSLIHAADRCTWLEHDVTTRYHTIHQRVIVRPVHI